MAVARSSGGTVESSSVRSLPPGALQPHLHAVNFNQPEAVRSALEGALAVIGGRGRDVIAVLPDAACRIVLLDFDALPDKREEAEAIVRFRLKKSLPFEVEKARVSYQAQIADGKVNVVAAVVLNSVLEEYESVLREAGCTPGVVVPSMLAALGQVDADVPTLVIKLDPTSTSFAIVNEGRLLLIRTVENPGGAVPPGSQLVEDIYPSLVFFQDTYGAKVQRMLVGGLDSIDGLNASLAEHLGVRAQELVSDRILGADMGAQRSALGAVAGALVG